MATKKPSSYTTFELEFLDRKLQELMEYIESKPFNTLDDRRDYKATKNGGVVVTVIATIEAQRSDLTKALKEYAEITKLVDEMREKKEKEIEKRGGGKIAGIMNEEE